MSVRLLALTTSICVLISGCATQQESPYYQQSTKYKVHAPAGQTVTTQPSTSYATYSAETSQTAQPQDQRAYNTSPTAPQTYQANSQTNTVRYGEVVSTRRNDACLSKEGNRKLIGTAAGGGVGALAGNKIIGGTKGTVLGAVVGGAAGYGIADKTIHCDPIPAPVAATTIPTSSHANYTDYSAGTPASTTVTTLPPAAPGASGSAPTDSAYGETFGTPGYHAMQANGEIDSSTVAATSVPIPAPVAAPIPVPAPAPITGYPQAAAQAYIPPAAAIRPPVTEPAPHPFAGNSAHKVVEGDTVYSLSRKLCVSVDDIKSLNALDGEFYIRLDDYIRLPASRC